MANMVAEHSAHGAPTPSRTRWAAGILTLVSVLATLPAVRAADPVATATAGTNPRLASIEVDIWPEYDRAAAALIIVKGEIANDVRLPAAVSMRIAASSKGPSAVAYLDAASGSLANLNYERKDAGDVITLKFQAPTRVFHIEYYEPLVTGTPERSFTYGWNGDFPTNRLRVVLQEPATSSKLSVQPPLDTTSTGQDGLRYRAADLGPYEAGKRQEVRVRYTKSDSRTSAEILKPKVAAAPVADVPAVPAGGSGPSKLDIAAWLVGIVAALGIGLGVWAGVMWWYGRKDDSAPEPRNGGFCTKCGAPRAPDARFCSKCGAKLGKVGN